MMIESMKDDINRLECDTNSWFYWEGGKWSYNANGLNKAPEPDGFPAEFYHKFWDMLKGDLMDRFVNY
jgi:hypothetical protein